MSSRNIIMAARFGFGPKPGQGGYAIRDVPGDLLREIERKPWKPAGEEALGSTIDALSLHGEFQQEKVRLAAAEERQRAERIAAAAREEAMRRGERPPPGYEPPAWRLFRADVNYRMKAALASDIGFTERLVWFWSNHFAVSVAKGEHVRLIAGAFEREAIRPHVFGTFAEMLRAAAQHPAMLIYLDNRQSIGPNSRAGVRRGRGLNENLAREMLELHTLGVDGGFSQDDVTGLARALTGWTVPDRFDEEGEMGAFFFNANRHEPGDKVILGHQFKDEGLAQGEKIVKELALHPSTAQHIGFKLARHFLQDDPTAAQIDRLSQTFLATGGTLPEVYAVLVELGAGLAAPMKVRSPSEFVVASLRATGRSYDFGQVLQFCRFLGQPIWEPPGPNGFPDVTAAWVTPEGMKVRLEVAMTIARQTPGSANPSLLIDQVFGDASSAETRQAVARAESRPQGIAIMLMSPEIQRR